MIQIEIDKFKIKIDNGDDIQVYPLNIIGYLINEDSEIVTFYDSYNKMIVLNSLFRDLVINLTPATRDNIDELLKDLFFINHYTKEEADELLDKKADKANTYTKGEVDDKLDKKADKANTYTKKEVDDKLTDVDNKLDEKQNILVSGTNIKSINGYSLLGSGNLEIEAGSGSTVDAYTKEETDTKLATKVSKVELVQDAANQLHYTLLVDNINKGEINIPKDQFLKSANYDSATKELVFVFVTESGETTTKVSVADLVDEYTAGNGLNLANNEFTIDTAIVATKADLATKADKSDTYNKGEVDSKIDTVVSGITSDLDNYYDKVEVDTKLGNKQDTLISSNNIKTINGESLLGSGNVEIKSDGIGDCPDGYSLNVVRLSGDILLINQFGNTYQGTFAATDSGVYKLSDLNKWEYFDLAGIKVYQIVQSKDTNNSIYAMTDKGIYYMQYSGKFEQTSVTHPAYSMVMYGDYMYFVTANNIYTKPANESINFWNILTYQTTSSTHIVVKGYSNNAYIIDDKISVIDTEKNTITEIANNIISTGKGISVNGYLYIPAADGVYKMNEDTNAIEQLTMNDKYVVTCVTVSGGILYCGTTNNGVMFYNDKYGEFDSTNCQYMKVNQINTGSDGNVYAATNDGIFYGQEYEINRSDQFNLDEYTFIGKDDDSGNLFIASNYYSFIVSQGRRNTYLRSNGMWELFLDNTKQDTLISGNNIKTINGESLLGFGNIEITNDDNLIVISQTDNSIKLTEDKKQYVTITGSSGSTVSVTLPELKEYAELHLLFNSNSGIVLNFPTGVLWQNKITDIKDVVVYEVIFTYLNNVNKWIAGYIKYE